jgi:hypothetical protein
VSEKDPTLFCSELEESLVVGSVQSRILGSQNVKIRDPPQESAEYAAVEVLVRQ